MKKRRWIFAWLGCLATVFGLYIHTVLMEAARQPSPGWSRLQLIAEQSGLSAYDLHNNSGIAVIPERQAARILYQEAGGLQQVTVDASGDITARRTLAAEFAPADRLIAYQQEGRWFLDALQGKALKTYRLEQEGLSLLGTQQPYAIKSFDRFGGQWALFSEEGLSLAGDLHNGFIPGEYTNGRWVSASQPALYLIAAEGGRKRLVLAEVSGAGLERLGEWSLPADAQTGVQSVVPYAGKSGPGALVELKDFRTGTVRLMDYRLMPAPQEKEILAARGDMNPILQNVENGEVRLLLSREQRKGDDESVYNIRQISWDGSQVSEKDFVTRTDIASIPISHWETGGSAFLLSAEITGDTKKIMLSGNSPELIRRTARLNREEVWTLLPGAVITLLPALMIGLYPTIYILAPVLAVLGGMTFLKFNWMESRYLLVARSAIGAHILFKIIFSVQRVLFNPSIPDISTQLPWYLNTPWAMGLALTATTLAAWKTARLRNPVWAPGDFWGPYMQFALIDLSVYILLVMPYYYAYVGLPIFMR